MGLIVADNTIEIETIADKVIVDDDYMLLQYFFADSDLCSTR